VPADSRQNRRRIGFLAKITKLQLSARKITTLALGKSTEKLSAKARGPLYGQKNSSQWRLTYQGEHPIVSGQQPPSFY